eukprot:2859708-Rhodomonas_salina.2
MGEQPSGAPARRATHTSAHVSERQCTTAAQDAAGGHYAAGMRKRGLGDASYVRSARTLW